MKLVKRIGYKLIVVMCIIATFCTFIASTPVEASKVNDSDFYYSGTDKGSYTVNKGFLETLVESLGAILDYLLGLCTMGVRMVFIGWTALFERCLTWIFKGASGEEIVVDEISSTNLISADDWITIDAIFFNHVPLLDINVFNFEGIKGYDSTGTEISGETEEHDAPRIIYSENSNQEITGIVETIRVQGEKVDFKAAGKEDKSLVIILKETIAGWYYTLRTISIMVMLILLIYVGIQLAIKSSTTDKAVYKKMLTDWVAGMILVFSIHYIMLFVITLNEVAVETIGKLRTGTTPLAVYEYGLEERIEEPLTNEELEFTLYDEVKTRAYDFKMSVGMTGMIMYMALVYYAWKFSFIYLKRYLTVAVLVIMAPLIAVSYAYNKVTSGKATIFSKWFKEFFFIVMLQTIHALIYVTFVQTALAISLNSISGFILTFILFNFMSKAEDIFRKIFGISGSLTDDIAKGQGIRATLQGLKSAAATMAVGKVAVNYTKGAAKVITKPMAKVAEIGFSKGMLKRAKNLDKDAQKEGYEDYSAKRKAERNKRTNAIVYGSLIKGLQSGEIDINELEENVNSLREGQSLYDENGSMIGIVDKKYITSKKAELDKLRAINEMTQKQKDDWMEEYDKWHNKKGNLRQVKMYVGDKWADIMDPKNYINRIRNNKDEIVGYEEIEKESEYGTVHHSKYRIFDLHFGKTTDSVGKRLAKQLEMKSLLGLNKEQEEALKAQKELIKNQILGFSGLFMGLSTLTEEPAASMALLATGIANASSAMSGIGRKREKTLKHYRMDKAGKYTFKGFEGKSEHTIAEGAKAMARAQMQKIVDDKVNQEASMKQRLKRNHPQIYKCIVNSGSATAITAGALTLGKAAFFGASPVVATAATIGAVGAGKFTGSILGSRVMDNAWSRYQNTVRAANKANAKAFEKAQKDAKTNSFSEILADQYFELEEKQYQREAEKHAEEFGEKYALVMAAMQEKIEEKTDAELLRDTSYEEEIIVEKTKDGKPKISLDAENKLLDNTLIEFAKTSGIMDVSKINISDKKSQLENILRTDLVTRGIIGKDDDISKLFDDLEKKLKDRQAKFKDEDKGREAVEDKIASDAIVSIMQERNLTDPSRVSVEEALYKYNETYLANTGHSSDETNSVLEGLVAQKGNGSKSPKTIETEKTTARITSTIETKKAKFSSKSKTKLDESTSKAIKETLKRKGELELDKKILEAQDKLENGRVQTVSDIIFNENGGVKSISDGSLEVSNTNEIIEMLQIQTQLHKDKENKILVEQKRGATTTEKVKAYQDIINDGSRKVNANEFNDGSRRVGRPIRGKKANDSSISTEITEILKRKKQEVRV